MKKTILTIILTFIAVNNIFAQAIIKKYQIPLNTPEGISCNFDNQMQEYFINGFDVDSIGNFYIACADTTNQNYLYKFDCNSQLIEKTKLSNSYFWMFIYQGDVLAIEKHSRLVYSLRYKENAIDLDSGTILSSFLSPNEIIIETSATKDYVVYSLPSLSKIGSAINKYSIPSTFQEYIDNQDIEYKGMVNNDHLFCKLELSDDLKISYEIILVNNSGQLIHSTIVQETDLYPDNLCTKMGCNIETLRILRNGKLYFLGADKAKKCIVLSTIQIN